MCQMNVLEAKTNFSKIIAMLERKEEKEVIIARAGKPVAKVVLYDQPKTFDAIFGIAKGKFTIPDDFDEPDEEIARMFGMID
ncbi:MAG: type II toxin-antitoxin system Phd/YefM family antitoxin [Treponema sp.]|nr:type II toxin-antitoxin system Phd/YefM family antitoxin [Treponema sp.]